MSMDNEIELRVSVPTFGKLSPRGLVAILHEIENILQQDDEEAIRNFGRLANVPVIIQDAAIERSRSYSGRRLSITGAGKGSITLFALLAGTAYFVLDKTVGESVKQGFSGTLADTKIRDLVSMSLNERIPRLINRLRESPLVQHVQEGDHEPLTAAGQPRHSSMTNIIRITFRRAETDPLPPTIGEFIAEYGEKHLQ